MMRFLAILMMLALAGCATNPAITTIRVPVAIQCQEAVPERPIMPTEELKQAPNLDQFTQAAQAEIERREGYETTLLASLKACTDPLKDRAK
jgi:hypothetical protein